MAPNYIPNLYYTFYNILNNITIYFSNIFQKEYTGYQIQNQEVNI